MVYMNNNETELFIYSNHCNPMIHMKKNIERIFERCLIDGFQLPGTPKLTIQMDSADKKYL